MTKPLFDQTIEQALAPVLTNNQFANEPFDNEEFEEHLNLVGGPEFIAEWDDLCEILHLAPGEDFKNPKIDTQIKNYDGQLLYDTTDIDDTDPLPLSNYGIYQLIKNTKSVG